MEKEDFLKLIDKYLDGEAEPSEELLLLNYFESFQTGTQWEEMDLGDKALMESQIRQRLAHSIRKHGDEGTVPTPVVHRVHFLRKWGWAAASAIILLGIGAYLWTANKKNNGPAVVVGNSSEIQPGKEGAILTLANGKQVVLDSLGNGVIASQNGAQAVLKNGALTYDPVGSASGELAYNTMTTPKGRQFLVTLPDGTKVWLNAASSIHYPTVFSGSERKVTVTGEAYFEVAKNARMPFRVNVNGKAEVEVLGTHFNVNAYEDESTINTTLLVGSVRVASPAGQKSQPGIDGDRPVTLRPGQQAQIANARVGQKAQPGIKVISNTDIDKVMAWKNGLFYFEGATLAEIMRQVERWYDIEVVYEKEIPNIEFEGKMTKGVSLSGLLMALESSDVHFRIEGRKLIVLP